MKTGYQYLVRILLPKLLGISRLRYFSDAETLQKMTLGQIEQKLQPLMINLMPFSFTGLDDHYTPSDCYVHRR